MRILNINFEHNVLKKELSYFIQNKGNYSAQPNKNKIILHYQWKEYYKNEINLWEKNPLIQNFMPLQSWIYMNRKKYLNKDAINISDLEILRAFKISGLYIGNSQFSPLWIKKFIEDYDIKSIYDPCGGWGHRIIGSYNIKYIYNDINTPVYKNCVKMIKELNIPHVICYNEDSSLFSPNDIYDCVFTCPPYWKKEIYSKKGAENLDYNDFLNWWNKTILHSLNNNVKYFAYVISNDLKEDMNRICIQNNLMWLCEKYLNNNINHFQRKPTSCIKKGESIQIFQNNNIII